MGGFYQINDTEYELYQAASGDWCVSVDKYGQERLDYNVGSLEDALTFILKQYQVGV